MLEIYILYRLCKKIAFDAKNKGYTPAGFVILTIVFWFSGQIGGVIVGTVIFDNFFMGYLLGILGIIISYGIISMIVNKLEDKSGFDNPEHNTNWQQPGSPS